MPIALMRQVSSTLSKCELTFAIRTQIDLALAQKQHAQYADALSRLHVQVVILPAQDHLPDAVFVEDTAVVVDEVAVMARMGSSVRAAESESMAATLAKHRPLKFIAPPATLDGGDVLQIGRKVYVGLSSRTNAAAIKQLRDAIAPYGYDVREVGVDGCLHLKTAICFVGRGTVLANPEWVDLDAFAELEVIHVPRDEPFAANILGINDIVLLPSSFPKTQGLLQTAGFQVELVDISEFQKAEGGLTCLCILLASREGEAPAEPRMANSAAIHGSAGASPSPSEQFTARQEPRPPRLSLRRSLPFDRSDTSCHAK